MMRASQLSGPVLLGSVLMAACLGGTDLIPSSAGGATAGHGGGGAHTTSSMNGGAAGAAVSSTTTSTGGAAGGTTTSMGGSGTTTSGMGGQTTSSSGTGGGTTTTTATGGAAPVGDPPCDVLAMLERKCWNCHGTTPHSDAALSLVTIADLMAPSDEDRLLTNAERSVITMQDPLDPMPPGSSPWATPAEIAAMEAWILAGYPPSTCGDLAKDPYAASPTCTSGVFIDPNGDEGEEMTPGHACNECHEQQNIEMGTEAPIYHFAGTVYPSAHEADDCSGGTTEGAEIEVIDANGVIYMATANAVGNFFFEDTQYLFKFPYTTRVVFQGRERWMDTPEMEGDCNKCHTPTGAEDAPGRILLP
jgi:hypothetical protein